MKCVETVQEIFSPEVSLILLDLKEGTRLDSKVAERLDKATEDYFIEVLREDLSKAFSPSDRTGGLL